MTSTERRTEEPDEGALQRRLGEYKRWFHILDGQIRHLERERQKFSAVVNHSGAGFLVLDASLALTFANDRSVSWFGDASATRSLTGLSCHEVLCRAAATCADCPAAQPLRTGEVAHREMRLSMQGQMRHVYATAVPLKSPEGQVEETIVMLQDVSEMQILRASEEALRASEERFRTIFENAAAGVVAIRPDGSLVQVNPAFCRMLGYTEEELLRMTVAAISHPADRERVLRSFQDIERGGRRAMEMESRYVRKDGQVVWTLSSSSWIADAEGRPIQGVALVQDITERKRAENLLRDKETRLRLHQAALLDLARSPTLRAGDLRAALREITESSSQTLRVERCGVWLYDAGRTKLVCVDVYQAAAEAHGEGGELAAADFPAYFRAMESDRSIAAHDAHHDPRTREFSASYLHPLGITSMLDAPVRKGGEIVGVVCQEHVGPPRAWTTEEQNFAGSIADLVSLALEQEDRRRAEGARDLLATAIDQAAESIVVTDTEGRTQYVNPAFGKISGYAPHEVLGRRPSFLDAEGEDADAVRGVWETLGAGRVWTGHLTRRRKDGGLYEEEATISPVRDGAGRIVNFVAVSRDVTRQAELEEQLRQAQKMEAIGSLAGGVAHDFNNLLTGILGYSGFVKKAAGGDSGLRRAAEVIERAAKRGAELTQQLLGFARKGKQRDVAVDVHRVIGDVVGLLSHTLDKNIAIDRDLEERALSVQGDPVQVQQLLLNLAVNARDAMPAGGRLTFRTELARVEEGVPAPVAPGAYVVVSVSDTGCGIPADDLGRIFEPFFTTKAPGKGTGMGLAMVYGIVESHGGTIHVESEQGRGTTFRVYLPLAAGEPEAEEAAVDPPDQATGRVLVVDDEEFIRALATEMLETLGYEVATAADGREAVDLFRDAEGAFDLVLLDMVMPRMGGRDCFRALKAIDPEVRTVLSTGYGFNVAAQEILDEGVMGFLPKPYTVTELADAVSRVLRRRAGASGAEC